jgi:type I restriction enzyme S subunit
MCDVGTTLLGDVAEVVMGQSPSGETCGKVPVGSPLLNGPTEFGLNHPVPGQWTTAPARFAREGDLLFCVRGSTTGRMNRADRDYAIGRGIAAIRGTAPRETDFIYYAMRATLPALLSRASGSVFSNLSYADVKTHELPWPHPVVRWAIAKVLGAHDDKIASNQALACLAEQLAVAHFEATGVRVPVNVLASVDRMQVRPADFESVDVDHFSLPAFDATRLPDRCPGPTVKSNKFRLDNPVVLVSKLNPHIPRVWHAVPTSTVMALASTEFVVLHPRDGLTSQELWAGCATTAFTAALTDRVTGTTGSHQRVRPDDVFETSVVDFRKVPRDIRAAVRTLVDRAAAARLETVHLARLRDALLPQLLSGELRVCDVEPPGREAV